METNIKDKFNIIVNRLTDIIEKSNDDNIKFSKELEVEIKDLEEIYTDLKEYVDLVKKSKAFKSISELYTNLVSIKKLIIELKEKKYKLNENDIRTLKSTSELLYKLSQVDNDEKVTDSDVDITTLLKKININ